MRLIDADALKEEVKTSKVTGRFFEGTLMLIDNAPTVNPCDNCDLYFKAMTKAAELDKMPMISKKHKGGAV